MLRYPWGAHRFGRTPICICTQKKYLYTVAIQYVILVYTIVRAGINLPYTSRSFSPEDDQNLVTEKGLHPGLWTVLRKVGRKLSCAA